MRHFGFVKLAAVLTAIVMLALIPAASLAEAVVAGERSFDRSPDLNEAANTYIQRENYQYTLYDAAGNALSDPYASMSSKKNGLFLTVANEEGVNTTGVLDQNGQLIIPMQYGAIEIESDKWILGIVLEETDAEPYEYRSFWGSGMYKVVSVDVYFEGRKIGSLERADYVNTYASAHGNYLGIRKADADAAFYLTSIFERRDVTRDDYSSSEFSNDYRKGVIHNATGQLAFVSACTLTPEEVEQSVWYDDKGDFVDLQGNLVAHGVTEGKEYNYVYYDGGNYFRTRSNDGYGLVTLDGTEVLPAVYDAIGGTSEGTYFQSGYQVVLKNGKLNYLDRAGNVTAAVDYEMSESDYRGFYNNAPFVTVDNMGKKVVITAEAGELAQKYQDAGYPKGGQRVLAVQLNDAWGVIDLQGNEVIPFIFRYSPDISNDGTLVAGSTDDGYVLYTIAYTEAPAVEAPASEGPADETWICPTCGETNTSKFCPSDGTPQPEEAIVPTCGNCGYQPADGVAPKFCPECGAAFAQ